jgi:hypothetical protein
MNEKTISLVEFIQRLGIKTRDEGNALWVLIANRDVYLDGTRVETGSFRWNASRIAAVLGGNYLDYYCGCGSSEALDHLANLFMDCLVTTTGYDGGPYQ